MKLFLHAATSIATAALLSFAAAPQAASAAADAPDVYRCSLLNDNGACARLPAPADAATGMRWAPGPYAASLIHLGQSVDEAIAHGRDVGEQPTTVVVMHKLPRQLSGYEAYRRFVSGTVAPERERDADVADGRAPVRLR